ncbi:MAG: hypothetical protein EXS69_01870 [Candidatus Zambryskibacteria bacterium]|nr:hypothetical protein [Candidatus Zambryskibacteria bacterium]
MAEGKSEAEKLFHKDHYKEAFWLIPALIVLGAIVNQLLYLIGQSDWYVLKIWNALVQYLLWFWPIWKIVAVILALVAIVWGIYSYLKLQEVETEEEKIYGKISDDAFLEQGSVSEDKGDEKWQRIYEHTNSNNPSDWRLAIIEADVMLEEVLRTLGYQGEGVGEMLKSVDPTDMLTLNNAWEGHKVRNRIAHAGGEFQLTERETRRVISLFETVFRELRAI